MTDTATRLTPKTAEPLTPDEQKRRFADLCEEPVLCQLNADRALGRDNGETLDKAFGKIVPPKMRQAKN